MTKPILGSEEAALGLTDEVYGHMAGLPDGGGMVELEQRAIETMAALQSDKTLSVEVLHGIRTTRERAANGNALGDVISGLTDAQAGDALFLAEKGVENRLKFEAKKTIAERNRTAGLAWTRLMGKRIGTAARNMVGLWNEGAGLKLAWGEGSYEDRRVEQEVRAQIAARFAGRTYDTLDPNDQKLVREEVGKLAPNLVAFNPQKILEWTRTTDSAVMNTEATPPRFFKYYELCEAVLGKEEIGSRYAIPILSLIQKDSAYRDHVEAVYKDRIANSEVQKDYETERAERAKQDREVIEKTNQIQRLEGALTILTQIREQEMARADYQRKKMDAEVEKSKVYAHPRTGKETGEEEKSIREYGMHASEAAKILSGKTAELKTKYKNEIEAAFPGKVLKDILEIEPIPPPTTPPSPVPFNAGGFKSPNQVDTLIEAFQIKLDGNAATGATAAVIGLKDELKKLKEDITKRDEAYPTTNTLSSKYKDFADLKTQHENAANERSKQKTLTSHQFLYEILNRQLKVKIPPTAGVPPAGTRNLPLEEAQIRAVIGTMMLMDRVDSTMDEGFAIRHARNITRNQLTRFIDLKSRLKFEEFVKNQLVKQEAFKELKDLSLKTMANDVLAWVNEDKLKEENIPELMRQLELLGQDQLPGEGKLDFDEDVRPLLYQIQLAYYRRRTETLMEQINKPGLENKAELLLKLMKEEAPKTIPPAVKPGSRPLTVKTGKQVSKEKVIERLAEKLKTVGEESEEGQLIKGRLDFLEKYASVFVADTLFNVMTRIPSWWRRRGAKKAAAKSAAASKNTDNVIDLATEREKQKKPAPANPSTKKKMSTAPESTQEAA